MKVKIQLDITNVICKKRTSKESIFDNSESGKVKGELFLCTVMLPERTH